MDGSTAALECGDAGGNRRRAQIRGAAWQDAGSAARIFELLNERSEVVCLIAAWKWINRLPVTDRLREGAVIERALQQAAVRELAPAAIRRLFELQMDCARDLQNRLHRHWRRRGFGLAAEVPSLELELRPKLDRLTERLLEAIDAAWAALSAPTFAQEWAAEAARLRSVGWSAVRIRELLLVLGSSTRGGPRHGAPSPAVDEPAAASAGTALPPSVILEIGEEM